MYACSSDLYAKDLQIYVLSANSCNLTGSSNLTNVNLYLIVTTKFPVRFALKLAASSNCSGQNLRAHC